MPWLTIYLGEGRIKNIYLTKEERKAIEKLKEESGFRSLKEAFFFYKENKGITPFEKIKMLEDQVMNLKRENEDLRKRIDRFSKILGDRNEKPKEFR